ncbi:hypothetical protein CC79DRAFT_1366300 [Sarocladium strictum]
MTLSETIVLQEAGSVSDSMTDFEAPSSGSHEMSTDDLSISGGSLNQEPDTPAETAGDNEPARTDQSDPTIADIKVKVIPKPVTIEDDPEPEATDSSRPATQEPELVSSDDVHLTPKVTVLTTTALPATTGANEVLPPLPITSADGGQSPSFAVAKDESNALEPTPVEHSPGPVGKDISNVVPLPAPIALSFLDADSPPVTKEAIRQSALNANRRAHPGVYNASPSSHSHSSTGSTAYSSDVFSRAEHNGESAATWSPSDQYSLKAEGHPPPQHLPPEFHRSWTSPETRMPPPPPMSHIGGSPMQPRFPQPSPFPFNEPIPLSGYQLLAAKLAGDVGGAQVKPIYRRFEALNHRLLLSLQDELGDFEEQLSALDASDTKNRTYPGGIYPASHRQEAVANGDLYWRKGEVLSKIGYRLHQYNKLLISFRDTTDLPAPTINDIREYQGFLNHGNYVTSDETRFLSATNDLITLDEGMLRGTDEYSEDLLTPMPRSATEPEFPLQLKPGTIEAERLKQPMKPPPVVEPVKTTIPPTAITHLALAIFVAVLVPIFTFAVIPELAGRITVVVLVASSVFSMLLQSGIVGLLIEDRGVLALVLCTVIYGGVMATTAATLR